MHLFELTRRLVDIDSTTGREREVAQFVGGCLRGLGPPSPEVVFEEAEPERPNVFAWWGSPRVVLSTHLDAVPPFMPSSEDEHTIGGRGSCDAKGILAAQIKAAERLLAEGRTDFGLLFLVGEERDSAGARHANQHPRGSQFLVNGEPTNNRLAVATKGALRMVLESRGRMAHSAYPELGESAIEKLLTALAGLRHIYWPSDPLLGQTTYNIGTIEGGRAPNIIPDQARAEVMFRLVGDSAMVRRAVEAACAGPTERYAEVQYVLEIPVARLGVLDGLPTTVVSFTTDIPSLDRWGRPYLVGPGSIALAHTERERVPKQELEEAVVLYTEIVKRLQAT